MYMHTGALKYVYVYTESHIHVKRISKNIKHARMQCKESIISSGKKIDLIEGNFRFDNTQC